MSREAPEIDPNATEPEPSLVTRLEALRQQGVSEKAFRWWIIAD